MEMKLSDILARLKVPGLIESNKRHTIAEKISSVLNVPIQPNQVLFKENTISLSVAPVIKSAITMKFSEIQEVLKKEGIVVNVIR
jgi:hypothetical protein